MAKIDFKSQEDRDKYVYPFVYLVFGSIFTMFVSFRSFNYVFAWIAPVFLIRFGRTASHGAHILIGIIPLFGAQVYELWGGWDMDDGFMVAVCFLNSLLLLGPLWIDRLCRKLDIFPKNGITTIFAPTLYVFIDYIIQLTPLGSVFSYSAAQAENLIMLQLVTFGGMWCLTFLIYWTAIIINELWEDDFDLKKAMRRPLIKIFTVLFVVAVLFGAFRLAFDDPGATVKVAGVTHPHDRDYWTVIDKGTKPSSKAEYQPGMTKINDRLFNISQTGVNGGAKIVFWSEGNGIYYQDDEAAFIARASAFASGNNVYFAPCVLKYVYNGTYSENKVLFFDKNGTMMYEYQKTISWYESGSDGILDYADTDYGRISTAICFDNDFPFFIHQASLNQIDMMLVPAFDTATIKKYHGQTALLRAVENGISMFRMVNKGISYAVSYLGDIRASQDFFDTADGALLYADMPMRRVTTLFQHLANWWMYLMFAVMGIVIGFVVYKIVLAKRRVKRDSENKIIDVEMQKNP